MAAVAVLIATLILPVLQIEGTSMVPTLVNGDIVLLTKTTSGFDLSLYSCTPGGASRVTVRCSAINQ